jgi:hypothetical protein
VSRGPDAIAAETPIQSFHHLTSPKVSWVGGDDRALDGAAFVDQ